jgi:hypothetical protein
MLDDSGVGWGTASGCASESTDEFGVVSSGAVMGIGGAGAGTEMFARLGKCRRSLANMPATHSTAAIENAAAAKRSPRPDD